MEGFNVENVVLIVQMSCLKDEIQPCLPNSLPNANRFESRLGKVQFELFVPSNLGCLHVI